MKINKKELRAAFDCDDTLIIWPDDHYTPKEGRVKIECPYEKGTFFYLIPHKRHINYLIAQKERKHEVIVWSQNGWAWAKSVVEALKLENYVDRVETKISKYFDDLPADSWMDRIFLEHDYENNKIS